MARSIVFIASSNDGFSINNNYPGVSVLEGYWGTNTGIRKVIYGNNNNVYINLPSSYSYVDTDSSNYILGWTQKVMSSSNMTISGNTMHGGGNNSAMLLIRFRSNRTNISWTINDISESYTTLTVGNTYILRAYNLSGDVKFVISLYDVTNGAYAKYTEHNEPHKENGLMSFSVNGLDYISPPQLYGNVNLTSVFPYWTELPAIKSRYKEYSRTASALDNNSAVTETFNNGSYDMCTEANVEVGESNGSYYLYPSSYLDRAMSTTVSLMNSIEPPRNGVPPYRGNPTDKSVYDTDYLAGDIPLIGNGISVPSEYSCPTVTTAPNFLSNGSHNNFTYVARGYRPLLKNKKGVSNGKLYRRSDGAIVNNDTVLIPASVKAKYIIVELQAGGGGGGDTDFWDNTLLPGSSGNYLLCILPMWDVDHNLTYNVSIGGGGGGGSGSRGGDRGGATSVICTEFPNYGAYLSATGGYGSDRGIWGDYRTGLNEASTIYNHDYQTYPASHILMDKKGRASDMEATTTNYSNIYKNSISTSFH